MSTNKILVLNILGIAAVLGFITMMIITEELPSWAHFLMVFFWACLFLRNREEQKIKKDKTATN